MDNLYAKTDVGMKHDTGKAPIARGFARYFPRAIEATALISQFGFDKYKEWGGWKKVPDAFNRYDDAHGRHDNALQRGETHCPESHKLHLAHRAWNAMATLELYLIEEEAKRGEETLRKDKSWINTENFEAWRADKFEELKKARDAFIVNAEPVAPPTWRTCRECIDYCTPNKGCKRGL
jgi:hypothetical protein